MSPTTAPVPGLAAQRTGAFSRYGIMVHMSSHLAVLALGFAIGGSAIYLVIALDRRKHRPDHDRARAQLDPVDPPRRLTAVRLHEHDPRDGLFGHTSGPHRNSRPGA